MPDICTNASICAGGNHATFTIAGQTVRISESDAQEALTVEERIALLRLRVRQMRQAGVTLAAFVNRVVIGEEATNVKIYQFFGPGATITKTNIGTAYVNIPAGLNGERVVVDFTGCTQYRLVLHANLIGVGQWGARVIRDSDNTVLHEAANLGAAGERELDTDWTNLPGVFLGQGLMYLRAQGKSTTATDDPVFRSLVLVLR